MRHRKSGVKLNRTTSHRQAMFRNMVTSLFKHDRIRTTDVKAKELRRWADRIITLAKRGDLHARRQVMAIVREKDVVHKLFENAATRFGNANGGYTRIVKLGRRPGDAAPISLIELISMEQKPKKARKKTKTAEPKAEPKADKVETSKPEPAETAPAQSESAETETASESAEPAVEDDTLTAAPAQAGAAADQPAPAQESPAKKEE